MYFSYCWNCLKGYLWPRRSEASPPLSTYWKMGKICERTLRSAFRIMAWCLDAFHKAPIYANWGPSCISAPKVIVAWVMLEILSILLQDLYKLMCHPRWRIPHQQLKHSINISTLTFNTKKIIKILKSAKSKTHPPPAPTHHRHHHHPCLCRPTIWNPASKSIHTTGHPPAPTCTGLFSFLTGKTK